MQDRMGSFTGSLAWEWVNPVSLLHRGLIFGMGGGLFVIAGITCAIAAVMAWLAIEPKRKAPAPPNGSPRDTERHPEREPA